MQSTDREVKEYIIICQIDPKLKNGTGCQVFDLMITEFGSDLFWKMQHVDGVRW